MNILCAPEGFNFLQKGTRYWNADWRASRPVLATIIEVKRKDSKSVATVEITEYALVGKTNENIEDPDREATVFFAPAERLSALFEAITRFPVEKFDPKATLSPYHLQRVL